MATAAFAEVATADPPAVHMPRELLRGLPRAVAVRLVGRALSWSGGGRKPHALAAVEALTDRLIREPVRTTLHGCIVRSDGDTIKITPETGRAAAARHPRTEPTHT
jgi:tRNA(Ile)-lysidine synthase